MVEVVDAKGLTDVNVQSDLNSRRLSFMPLDHWYGRRIADFREARDPLPDVIAITRGEARAWAQAAHVAGLAGVLHRLKKDPHHRCGLAVFGERGPWRPPLPCEPPNTVEIPVRARNEWAWLVGREDPLAE
jgi:hypothetical protein